MPTPRPIRRDSSVDTLETLIAWLSRSTAKMAMTRAKPAPASGSSAGSSAPPKMISRMTSAAIVPTPVAAPGLGRSSLVMDVPLSETRTIAESADSAALIRLLASAVVTCADCASQVTVAKATVPSLLTCAVCPAA
jgi:hypothetical protein